MVRALGGVPGIRAIVLGGSRARGEATAQSDYDIGLYYEADHPIDTGRLAKAAMLLPGAASSSVTAIGEWGPWINGGVWLTVAGTRVDLLYRELGKVRGVIEACRAGRIERVYQPGHPHAFVSAIYMGEVALAQVLWDPEQVMAPLKRLCTPYPPALAEGLIRTSCGRRSSRSRTPRTAAGGTTRPMSRAALSGAWPASARACSP